MIMPVAYIHHEDRDKILPLCASFTPLVEPYKEEGIFLGLDTGGCEKFADSEIYKKGRWGVAASKFTAGAAWLAAEKKNRGCSGGLWLHKREEAAFLAPLPVDFLWPLRSQVIEHLKILGLYRIKEAAAIPKEELCLQFGKEEGLAIFNYSRGIDPRPVLAKYPPDTLELERKTEGVINKEGLKIIFNELLTTMSKELKSRGQALQTLRVELSEENGNTSVISKSFVQPVSVFNPGLAEHLAASLAVGSPVVMLKLTAGNLKAAKFIQCVLWEDCLLDGSSTRNRPKGNDPCTDNGKNRTGNADNVQRLVASIQKLLPNQNIFFGNELKPSRREKALSLWDPFRFQKK